jgi:hypothetical protein
MVGVRVAAPGESWPFVKPRRLDSERPPAPIEAADELSILDLWSYEVQFDDADILESELLEQANTPPNAE